MLVSFTIKSPPFSLNSAYYRNRQLTKEARKWRSEFLLQLMQDEVQAKIQQVRKLFQPSKNAVRVTYDFLYPRNLLFTKKGEISRRSMDLTNIEKLVQDNLFEARYNGREIDGHIIQNFDIDDKFIVDLRSRKLPHDLDHHLLHVSVELLPSSQLHSVESIETN